MKRPFGINQEEKLRAISIKHMSADAFLIYRLYEKADATKDFDREGKIYSLSITKIFWGGKKSEECRFDDISRESSEADRVFRSMSRGRVTPCTADEILSDLIGAFS